MLLWIVSHFILNRMETTLNFDHILNQLLKTRLLAASARIKVVIFCDPGVDDMLMLLQMLSSQKVEILGIIPVRGNASSKICLRNTLALCEYIGRTDIKIYPGKSAPFVGLPVYGKNGIGQLKLGTPKYMKPELESGISFACNIIKKEKIILISTANLTEPAEVLTYLKKKYPESLNNIMAISMMGGVVNHTQEANYPFIKNKYTEANFGDNPKATKKFLDITVYHKIPIFLSTLDLTHSILVSKTDILSLKNIKNPAAECAYNLIINVPKHYRLKFRRGPDGEFRQPIHDVHASSCLLHPELYQGQWVTLNISKKKLNIINNKSGNIFLLTMAYINRKEFIGNFINDCKNFTRSKLCVK
jgi:inosine-uridine nucleoside N-ribohydrolase